jgi:hypothetical protein
MILDEVMNGDFVRGLAAHQCGQACLTGPMLPNIRGFASVQTLPFL